jgi:hypothetical protein
VTIATAFGSAPRLCAPLIAAPIRSPGGASDFSGGASAASEAAAHDSTTDEKMPQVKLMTASIPIPDARD